MPQPIPAINLDGSTLTCGLVADDTGRDVLPDDRATLLGSMSINWGRDDAWTQPEASVITFNFWEAQPGAWLSKIATRSALRRPVAVTVDTPYKTLTIFDGFTTNVDVKASRQRTPAGMTDGWLVSVQASDRSGFLGQIRFPNTTLIYESMQNRAVYIRGRAAPAGIREFYFEDRYRTGEVKQVDPTDMTVLDAMKALYTSFADQWTYNPHRNVVIRIPSGSTFAAYSLKFGRAPAGDDPRTVRMYPPDWIDPTGKQLPIDQEPYPGGYIGACDVTGDIVLSADSVQDITHVVCKWFDKPNNRNWVSTVEVVPSPPPPHTTLQFESWYDDGTLIDPIMQDIKTHCLNEGARPMHPQIVWDTKLSGPVPDWGTFENLTLPAQTIRMVVLAGSPFSAATGHSPVWHPAGGTIAYERGHWRLTTNLSPTTQPLASGFKGVTCAQLAASSSGSTVLFGDLDRSITCFDLRWINDPAVYVRN